MIRSGVDIVRLNFSHGSHEEHAANLRLVREVEAAVGRPVGVLQDLCGPKIRTTKLKPGGAPLELAAGSKLTLISRANVPSGDGVVGCIYEGLAADVKAGQRLLFSDGLIEARIESVNGDRLSLRIINGGVLKGSQGINAPDASLAARSMTEKDLQDLEFGMKAGVDLVAVSFVKDGSDIRFVRQAMARLASGGGSGGSRSGAAARLEPLPVIAKIETPGAMTNMAEIIAESQGIMVARGDLGVELAPNEVPIAQKQLVLAANRAGKPCIVATQMLESMIVNPRPTRAEVSDVSNAIFERRRASCRGGRNDGGNRQNNQCQYAL
jgi:pyruvate kinase